MFDPYLIGIACGWFMANEWLTDGWPKVWKRFDRSPGEALETLLMPPSGPTAADELMKDVTSDEDLEDFDFDLEDGEEEDFDDDFLFN